MTPSEGCERPTANQTWAMDSNGFRSRTFRIRYCYEEVSPWGWEEE